jgi:hypothetical protein
MRMSRRTILISAAALPLAAHGLASTAAAQTGTATAAPAFDIPPILRAR